MIVYLLERLKRGGIAAKLFQGGGLSVVLTFLGVVLLLVFPALWASRALGTGERPLPADRSTTTESTAADWSGVTLVGGDSRIGIYEFSRDGVYYLAVMSASGTAVIKHEKADQ